MFTTFPVSSRPSFLSLSFPFSFFLSVFLIFFTAVFPQFLSCVSCVVVFFQSVKLLLFHLYVNFIRYSIPFELFLGCSLSFNSFFFLSVFCFSDLYNFLFLRSFFLTVLALLSSSLRLLALLLLYLSSSDTFFQFNAAFLSISFFFLSFSASRVFAK